jgi:hypothetical protein
MLDTCRFNGWLVDLAKLVRSGGLDLDVFD